MTLLPTNGSILHTAVFGSSLQVPQLLTTMTEISELAKQLGKCGGIAFKKKYGKVAFSDLGKRGMANRWKKIICPSCGFEGYKIAAEAHEKTAHHEPA